MSGIEVGEKRNQAYAIQLYAQYGKIVGAE